MFRNVVRSRAPLAVGAKTSTRLILQRSFSTAPPGGAPGGAPGGSAGKKPDNTPILIIGALAAGGLAYYLFRGDKSTSSKVEQKAHEAVDAAGAKANELEKKAKDALGK